MAGAAIGIATIGSAAAAPATRATRSDYGTVTRHYSLAGSAFAPDGLHNTAEDYFNHWDPSELSNQNPGRCFNTGLSLPPDATLQSVKAYYTAGSAVMYFEVNRQDLIIRTGTVLVSFDSTIDATPTYTSTTKTVAAADAVVNLGTYAYSVGVCPNGTTTFAGLTITYPQKGP